MLSFMLAIKVTADRIPTAVAALSEIDRQANGHEGVLTFMWFQHQDDPTRFTLVEQWRSQKALDAHIAKIGDIWKTFTPCLDGAPVSTKLTRLVTDHARF